VGAHLNHAGSLSDAGAAYIYTYNGSSWDTGTKIVAPDKEAADRYGYSVGMSSDGTRVIVGAYLEHAGVLTDTGSAYIYTYDGSNWDTGTKISAPVGDRTANDQFGTSVAMNSDGKKVIVGAQLADPQSLSSAGFAYVFTRDTTHHLTTDLKLQSNTWHNLTYAYQGEGGSRVTYLDGRKVTEDPAEDTFRAYPPFEMTGHSQGGYVASASGEELTNRAAWTIFGDAPNTGWRSSGPPQYNTDGTYAGIANLGSDSGGTAFANADRGEWVKIELPYKINLNYFTLQVRNSPSIPPGSSISYGRSEFIKNGKVWGSNDGISWSLVHTISGTSASSDTVTNSYAVGSVICYKYYGLVITDTNATVALATSLGDMKLYGHRENDLVRLPDPTNVLKYPHIAMTGPAQRGYVHTGSSEHSSTTFAGFNGIQNAYLFDNDPATFWHTNSNGTSDHFYDGSGGSYGSDSVSNFDPTGINIPGEWVQLKFPHKLKISKVHIRARSGSEDQACEDFAFYGSQTNAAGSWTLIQSFTGQSPQDDGTSYYDITSNPPHYKYILMLITRRVSSTGSISLAGLQYYGTEEASSIPLQIGGGNIDKVANFRVYDKFIGEDQALEIWDAQKDEFGRTKSSMTLQKGRLGIGTTEPEGRLAVADEPDATTYGLQEFPPKPLLNYKRHLEGHGEFCVSASSQQSATTAPWKVFDKSRDISSSLYTWSNFTDSNYNGTDNTYNPTATTGGGIILGTGAVYGEWIKLELPYKINLKYMKLNTRAPNDLSRMPEDFKVYGSNDDLNWTELISVTSRQAENFETTHNTNIDSMYRYFGLVVTKISGQNNYFRILELRYFGYREQVTKQSVLHDGQLTLTKNLTVPRIGPALGEYPTPRRENLKVEFDTSLAIHGDESGGRPFSTSGQDIAYAYNNDAHYSVADKAFKFPSGTSTATDNLYGNHGFTLGTSPAHTQSLWVKRTSYGYDAADYQWAAMFGNASGSGHMSGVLFQASTHRISFDINNTRILSKKVIALNRWYHVVCTFSGGTSVWNTKNCKIYIDGVDDTDLDSLSGSNPFILGSGSVGTWVVLGGTDYVTRGMTGLISNYKLYDVALTPDEVYTLYKQGKDQQTQHLQLVNTTMTIGPQNRNIDAMLDVAGRIRVGASTTLSFTGQHICSVDEPMEKGLIVSAKKNRFVKLNGFATGLEAITVDESLPIVSLSNVSQDKACFGVVSSIEKPSSKRKQEIGGVISETIKERGDNRAIVNSVGEGAIWVVDTGGALESGDYITTSNVTGYGQKQDDDVLHNYTVAKITMDCDFTGSNVAVQTIKREETGTQTIMEDTWNQLVDYDRSSNTETQYSNTLAPSAYTDQPGYTPREVTTIVDYTDGSNIVSIAEWSNLESNIQNTYQSNTFTEIVDYTKFVNLSEWSNLTTDVQNTYSEAEITTYYQIQRGENVLDENGQLQFEDKTGATEAPYERRFLDASGAQTDSANAVHIAAFVGCTYHCG
jgi:hypothetical protein